MKELQQPDETDPLAYVPQWLELMAQLSAMIVVAWSDDVARKTVLRSFARQHDTVYITCRQWSSRKEFLRHVAEGCRILRPGATATQLFGDLQAWITSYRALLVLDEADRLPAATLRSVRGLHVATNRPIVLATGTTTLGQRIDAVDDAGSFWSRTVWHNYDVPLSTKQKKRTDALARLNRRT